jgi:hypothetical protein
MDERATPGFVATIDGAPVVQPPGVACAATEEASVIAPTEAIAAVAPRRRPGARVMSRVLLAAIAAAFALYAAGVGGDLLGLIRSGASARTVPVQGGSLLHAVALEVALHGLPQGRVEALRVAADRIDARIVVDGRVRLVRITARGSVTDVPATAKPNGTRVRVDPRAPARIVQAVTRRTRAPVAYLLLEDSRWELVLGDGRQFSANPRGRAVRAG